MCHNDIELFGVNNNPTQKDWTDSPKAYGHIYIDDAAIGCPLVEVENCNKLCVDWGVVGPEVERKLLAKKSI